jgi:glycine oxidase
MLAPVTEAEFGEDALLQLNLDSAQRFKAFAHDLGVPLHETGTLAVARDSDDAEELERLYAYRTKLGLPADRLLPTKARRLEPALAPTVRLAVHVATDHSVDPRQLVAALQERVVAERGTVTDVSATTVTLDDGTTHAADRVVVAAGAWSGAFGVPVRPVKGQVIRLRDPRGAGLVTRTIRTEHAYLVPRADGRYVLGATVEERGWDDHATAGGVFELIRDVSEVVPGILELDIEEIAVGFRPGTPDNTPLIEERDGVIHATGHFRNGVLLAPVTADRVADMIGVRA